MTPRIWLSPPHTSGKELDFIQDAFAKNWIAPIGENVTGFEQDICSFLGKNIYATSTNTGTAALHLALIILGVKRDDYVICQDLTFVATVNPAVYLGATPVLVDSERETWNISPELLETAIKDCLKKGKKPKAIVWVNLYGMPAKIDEIRQIAQSYEIPLLEDAAESLGSKYKGDYCGTFGDIAMISFNGNKIITTSNGGVLLSKNKEFTDKARFLASQARDDAPYYQHSTVGYNYALSNISAGIGRGQMMVLPQRVEQRRKNNQYYREHLADVEGISFQTEPSADFYSNYWLTSIIVDAEKTNGITREDLRLALNEVNIESRPLWKPMHLQPIFNDCPYYGDGTSDALFENGLCLPSGSMLTEKELSRVVEIIRQKLKNN
ncbi:MAG: aminotransferase class I/II-fold pyridoxal phosphate-dependent enzyme [Dysgonamonadaceae bacterium]|jgi:dTDP-4-amino-4,6-dideoxygalactose transaminase|nr:aminotransferase class I/II-fold pyridoxal phosphate-dependent enzyme [Dysgonamonadaceae bacterium]